ncbi:carboxypeptidase-like regulatory domain-containing protein [Ferruginibacter sp. HRS2-29]|uniref:carboxypeptidase-like regulatory domain-containing protein n=1 Tax=Ferruginibacter sp. HRS2-29 TaxID=2487334 RepID=UPI0020CE9EEF|nr:carboxypeptidase-like regulatory domain-containing protein [Ferruginibacter sp. HRS2-29]MCP9749825.1 carboxypeptidase regulatory-like domain-containing protein [Ferruginibacter sp. HRS2-29]
MRFNRLLILFLAAFLSLTSCKKNYSEEEYIGLPTEVPADPSIKVNASVAGFIMDENNEPVGGARVTAGNGQAFTDAFGYFRINNVLLAKMAGFITITKTGYYKSIRTFQPMADKETFLRTKLLTKNETGSFAGTSGGTITTADGAKIVFSEGSLIADSTNLPYTGTVHVSARTIDINKTSDMQLYAPGDNRGVDTAGLLKLLRSYATIAVELTGNNGEKLQLAPGKTATLTIPIAASVTGTTPSTIALWSVNEATGLWKQESTATKNGNAYTGNVSHFSFWEGADPSSLVSFTAQVVNTALQPLANVPVRISQAGAQSYNSGFGYTDANGMVNGSVPAHTQLVLDIVTPCAIAAYSHNFTTANSDIDLGTLTGNLGQNLVTISGTANNCSGQPVTNGYVQTYDGGFYNRINIVNGSFSFAGLACTNLPVNYIVVDKTTNQQNQPQTFNLVPGANNLGVNTACGISSVSTLSYIFDGVTRVVTEPADTMAAFSFNNLSTNIIQMLPSGTSGSPAISFEISGGYSLGSNHFTSDIWFPDFPSGRGKLAGPATVTITEYGNTGGFISGSFSADNVQDFNNASSVHAISVTFRVRRNN